MDKCQCSLSIRLTGDGCRHCQPQLYIDLLGEWLDEARKERDELQDGLAKCRDAFESTSITDVEIEGLWAQAIGNPSDVAQYVEAMVKTQQWQPIATAPTLQDVLVFNYASEDAIVAAFDGENWHTGWEPLLRDAGKLMPLIPTHWMPLPKPPTE